MYQYWKYWIRFEIKTGYNFQLLTTETLKFYGSTEKKIQRYKYINI